jgi:hypothetical protein
VRANTRLLLGSSSLIAFAFDLCSIFLRVLSCFRCVPPLLRRHSFTPSLSLTTHPYFIPPP